MSFEIIDFHTHPFIDPRDNICAHKEFCHMSPEDTRELFRKLEISHICGSVIDLDKSSYANPWEKIRHQNDTALRLRDLYGDFYIPGFHVHPDYVNESIQEIERMHKEQVNLIGELVPYLDSWDDYSRQDFSEIMDAAEEYHMVVSIHHQGDDPMDALVQAHPNLVIVGAHPDEYPTVMRHIERTKMSKNYYLDVSGTGIFRHGMLRHFIDCCGADRVLFGSDFPTCNPAMFRGGVRDDPLLTDEEKQLVLSGNAKRLLGLT